MAFDQQALTRLIKDSGLHYRESGQSYKFECPRCHKSEKLYLRKSDGRFKCFYCSSNGNFSGKAEFALRELLSLPLREIQKQLYGHSTEHLSNDYIELDLADFWNEEEDGFTSETLEPALTSVVWPPDFVGPDNPKLFVKGARYLHSRGVTLDHVQTYDLRYSPVEKRVIFPVKVEGKLVGWQGRYIGPTEFFDEERQKTVVIPKILTSKSLTNAGGRYLMFQDRLKASEHAVLSEGPITAIKAHRCGGNVASMGKEVTQFQLQTIARQCKKLYLALDPDAGFDIMRIVVQSYEHMQVFLMTTPQNFERWDDPDNQKDNGDLAEEEVYDLFRSAKPEPFGKIYVSVGGLLVH
jgi:hypothetical protein